METKLSIQVWRSEDSKQESFLVTLPEHIQGAIAQARSDPGGQIRVALPDSDGDESIAGGSESPLESALRALPIPVFTKLILVAQELSELETEPAPLTQEARDAIRSLDSEDIRTLVRVLHESTAKLTALSTLSQKIQISMQEEEARDPGNERRADDPLNAWEPGSTQLFQKIDQLRNRYEEWLEANGDEEGG